jgi:succinate dehydrogenase/fumarate reductase flavoprotein subunit
MLQRAYQADFEQESVTAYFSTRAERLLTDGGKVVGVVVDSADGKRELYADAVVLTTGGYQANPVLRARFQPQFIAEGPYLGIDTCRGDGHLMGQAVGADLVNMTYVPPLVIVSSSFVEDAIAVNSDGRRFHDEAGLYDERVEALLAQDKRCGWYIFDQRVAQKKGELIAQMPRAAVSAASLEELASSINVPVGNLVATVSGWNDFLRSPANRDPEFGRVVIPAGRMGIESGPFGAVPMIVGVNFVAGGFTTTRSMQVVDVFGDAITGLYAAGDCAGGLNPVADLGGIRIAGGLTLGRVAGAAAAARESSEPGKPTAFGAYLPSNVNTKLELFHLQGRQ